MYTYHDMKVAFDTTPLNNANLSRGVGRYTFYLWENLKKIDGINLFPFKTGEKIPPVDIIHRPYFDLFYQTLPLIKPISTVVTIHDLIPFVFPEEFPAGLKGKLKWYLQKNSLKNVKAIIADSVASKNDIVKYACIPSDKIHVVYLGPTVSPNVKNIDVKSYYHLPDKYLLYIGDVNYNKNIPNLYQAFSRVAHELNLSLVLVGKAFLDLKIKESAILSQLEKKLGIDNKIIKLGFVGDDELAALYKNAFAYIQPSLYEGFGLPVLDAFVLGCPVLSSNSGSLKEITGDAALLFNPEDPKNIAAVIKNLFNMDNSHLKNMTEKGKIKSEEFSWSKTAKETFKIYEAILNLKHHPCL